MLDIIIYGITVPIGTIITVIIYILNHHKKIKNKLAEFAESVQKSIIFVKKYISLFDKWLDILDLDLRTAFDKILKSKDTSSDMNTFIFDIKKAIKKSLTKLKIGD